MDFLNSLTEATTNLEFMIKSSIGIYRIYFIRTLGTNRGRGVVNSTAIKVVT